MSGINYDDLSVGFVTFTVGHWDLMPDCMNCIYRYYPQSKKVFVFPNIDRKLSVSGLMNMAISTVSAMGCTYMCYVADDVRIGPDSVQKLLQELIENNLYIVGPAVYRDHIATSIDWSFWVAKVDLFEKVGPWDESFYPAYFEDNDYEYRIKLLFPEKIRPVDDITYEHIGSVTVKRLSGIELTQHHLAFERNKARYITKWGGLPREEKYKTPYNL